MKQRHGSAPMKIAVRQKCSIIFKWVFRALAHIQRKFTSVEKRFFFPLVSPFVVHVFNGRWQQFACTNNWRRVPVYPCVCASECVSLSMPMWPVWRWRFLTFVRTISENQNKKKRNKRREDEKKILRTTQRKRRGKSVEDARIERRRMEKETHCASV